MRGKFLVFSFLLVKTTILFLGHNFIASFFLSYVSENFIGPGFVSILDGNRIQTILPYFFILNSNCTHAFPPRFPPPPPIIHPHIPLAQGLLPPRGHTGVEIILRPSAEDPRDLRDRFMLRAGASSKPVRRLLVLFYNKYKYK